MTTNSDIQVAITKRSRNKKVGPIPVTTSAKSTCPPACRLHWSKEDSPCYAEAGFHTRMHWDKVSAGERGVPWPEFIDWVLDLPEGTLWRHNVAGDLPGQDDVLDKYRVYALKAAASHTQGFTYTHYSPTPYNRAVLETTSGFANRGFVINQSTDTMPEAYNSYKLGRPTVVLVSSEMGDWRTIKHKDMKVARCPAEYLDTDCNRCRLCAVGNRKVVVGFTSHGVRKSKADIIARDSDG